MQTPKIMNVFFLFVYIIFVVTACGDVTIKEQKYVPKIKGMEKQVELIRFEQAFFEIDTNNISNELQKLKEKYPEFTQGYLGSVLGVTDLSMEEPLVKGYLNYPDARYTYDTVQQVFADLPTVQQELNELATYYQYYFLDAKPLTKAFTYLAEYHGDRLAVLEDGFVGLPLDMALGEGYPPYTFLKIPGYDQRTCNKTHLVAKAADAMAQNLVGMYCKSAGNHLIDLMLYNGKIMYLTDIFLPTVADSTKFGFSDYQMQTCKGSELKLYEHLSKEELMYSSDSKKVSKFVTKGPFNPSLDLPGNSGSWLGYRMILSYVNYHRNAMKQAQPKLNEQALEQELLKKALLENDPQKFLMVYKPPKG